MLRTLTIPLPIFGKGIFFELLTEIWRGKDLKNIFFAAVFKKFTNEKGCTNTCFVYPFLPHS